jgi:hypothetical protein
MGACSKRNTNDFTPSSLKRQSLKLQRINKFQLKTKSDTLALARLQTRFKISPDGSRLAFYDRVFRHIVVTDRDGKIKYIAGEKGKGPSEFVNVEDWCFDEYNNLIVYDANQRLMKIFDSRGDLRRSLNLSVSQHGFYITMGNLFARDSVIYVGILQAKYNIYNGSGKAAKSKMIATFDYDGHLIKTFAHYDPYVDRAPMYTKRPLFDIDFASHKLYSTHADSYRIQIFNLINYNKIGYFGYKSKDYKISDKKILPSYSKRKISEMSLKQSFPMGLSVMHNYILFYFGNLTPKWNQTKDVEYRKGFIEVFDRKNHDFLAELQIPGQYGATYKSKLYVITNTNPNHYTIGIYKIQKRH